MTSEALRRAFAIGIVSVALVSSALALGGGRDGRGQGGGRDGGYSRSGSYGQRDGGQRDGGQRDGGGRDGGSRGSGPSYSSRGGADHNLSYSRVSSAPRVSDYTRGGADLGYLRTGGSHVSGYSSFRTGYYHYSPGFHDRDFAYRGYVYDPFLYHAYLSPFFYYPFLPAYIGLDGVTIVAGYGPLFIGRSYVVYPYYYGGYNAGYNDGYNAGTAAASRSDRLPALDEAVDQIVDSFQKDDFRALDLLIGRRNKVAIFQDGKYAYSLDSDAYYDLMRDTVRTSKTSRYEILSVRRDRNDAYVIARHTYIDPWNHEDAVYHTYKIHVDGRNATILEFGTSKDLPRY